MKRCSSCKKDVCKTLFFKNKTSKDGLGAYCKPCALKKRKQWSEENPEKQKNYKKDHWIKYGKAYEEKRKSCPILKTRKREANKRRWEREREKYFEFKKTCCCERCGISDYRVLQFHHRDSSLKAFTVSHKAGRLNFQQLKEEIDKCSVLCSNCHIILHFEDRGDFDTLA